MRTRLIIVAAMLALPAIAQSPIVVDQSGGGDYRDIQSAINSAQPGARIRVRAADYTSFTITKSLHIFGDPGATVTGFPPRIVVLNTAANHPVTVSGFRSAGSSPLAVTVQNCAGHVHLQDLVVEGIPGDFAQVSTITDSPRVTAAHLHLVGSPALRVERSELILDDSRLEGRVQGNANALRCSQSEITLIDGHYGGGSAVRENDVAGAAIHMTQGQLTIASVRSMVIHAGESVGTEPEPFPAIHTSGGELVIDPAVERQGSHGAPGIEGDATVSVRPVHALTTELQVDSYYGVFIRPTVRASDADHAWILLSLSAPVPFETPVGDLWILGTYIGLQDRHLDQNGRAIGDVHLAIFAPVPPLVVQGVTYRNGYGFQLTNPTVIQPYTSRR